MINLYGNVIDNQLLVILQTLLKDSIENDNCDTCFMLHRI